MRDPHFKEFKSRLRKIDAQHRDGVGWAAAGAIGQSYYTESRRRSLAGRWLRPIAFTLLAIIVVKGAVHAYVGAESYDASIAVLGLGGTIEKVGAYVLQADPLTVFVSGLFGG